MRDERTYEHVERVRPSHLHLVHTTRREKLEAEKYRAALLLEHLRHKGYARRGTLASVMQRLGDWWRK